MRGNAALIDEACALRSELPTRSAAQIAEIVSRRHGVRIAERTVAAHLRARGLSRAALGAAPRAFGRYEASRPNERWITDVLIGPFVPHPRAAGSRRARLFLIVDDHSRLLVHGRWVNEENTRAGQDVLRAAIERRGLPEALYADNGAPFANAALERACAVLGVRLIHSRDLTDRLANNTEWDDLGIDYYDRPPRPRTTRPTQTELRSIERTITPTATAPPPSPHQPPPDPPTPPTCQGYALTPAAHTMISL